MEEAAPKSSLSDSAVDIVSGIRNSDLSEASTSAGDQAADCVTLEVNQDNEENAVTEETHGYQKCADQGVDAKISVMSMEDLNSTLPNDIPLEPLGRSRQNLLICDSKPALGKQVRTRQQVALYLDKTPQYTS